MNQRINLTVLAALTAGLVAACGDGDDGTDGSTKGAAPTAAAAKNVTDQDAADQGAGPIDVCSLVDSATLDRLFDDHFSAGEPVHHEQTGGDQCVWDNGQTLPLKQFSITVWREAARSENFAGGDVTADKLWKVQKDYADAPEPLDLGDDAYLSGTALEVLDGTTIYSFTTGGGESRMAIDGMKQIAAEVVG